jgi:hypothetical protein
MGLRSILHENATVRDDNEWGDETNCRRAIRILLSFDVMPTVRDDNE